MATSTPDISIRQQHLRLLTAFRIENDDGQPEVMCIGIYLASGRHFIAPLDLEADKPILEDDVRCWWGLEDFDEAIEKLVLQEKIIATAEHLVVPMANRDYLESYS